VQTSLHNPHSQKHGRQQRWYSNCNGNFPGDPGQIAPLLFNLYHLEPGQGLFLPPGVLHSYIHGTILEIMACSDNVIRGGLTSKHIDVELLLMLLDLTASAQLLHPEQETFEWGVVARYTTPAHEFSLSSITVPDEAPFFSAYLSRRACNSAVH